jgi:hypothetical protein
MNIQRDEFHGINTRDITSPSSNKFHEERTQACLDIVDETHEPFP